MKNSAIRIWLIFINYLIAFALSIISQSKLANSIMWTPLSMLQLEYCKDVVLMV